jgi:O-6-methylguanine DNA methyltransferase
MPTLWTHVFTTVVGTIRTAATEKGLVLVALPNTTQHQFDTLVSHQFTGWDIRPGGKTNNQAENQISAYLAGKRKEFSIPLDVRGTPFQQKVLRRVARIPYGKTMSYGDIARAMGQPGASRAVGSANAHNHLPLVIPCHRVVAANGLGGYGGGLPMKQRLLTMEGAL